MKISPARRTPSTTRTLESIKADHHRFVEAGNVHSEVKNFLREPFFYIPLGERKFTMDSVGVQGVDHLHIELKVPSSFVAYVCN